MAKRALQGPFMVQIDQFSLTTDKLKFTAWIEVNLTSNYREKIIILNKIEIGNRICYGWWSKCYHDFCDLLNTLMGFDPIPREPGNVAWWMGYQGLGLHVSRKQTTFRVTKIFSLFI